MHNGLKFRGQDGVERAVSSDNPLPVTAGGPGGAPVTATLDDVLAELQAQTALLQDIKTNTTPTP